jgi:hypothetical protein
MATPNLVLPTGRSAAGRRPKSKSLAALIDKLNAAVVQVEKWSLREDRLSYEYRNASGPVPKVKGGTRPPSRIVTDGKPDIELEGGDWFYHSREAIEEDRPKVLARAGSEEERQQIEGRFVALLADWDAQEADRVAHKPRGLDHAKRMLSKAHSAWSGAEDEIVNYRPRSIEEVMDLLAFAGRDGMRGVFFTPEDGQLKFMMRNAAEVLGEHLRSAE